LRITKTLLAIFMLLMSATAGSMGIGDIKLNSGLNQPLNAKIQLFSVRPDEFDSIIVRMGSLKDFTNAGIDKNPVLNDVKFKVLGSSDGSTSIQLNSRKPIREPFLNFLVEVNWPDGRVLREYTLLLDPPVFARPAVAKVDAPVAAAPSAPAVAVVQEPAPSKPVPVKPKQQEELFPRIDISIEAEDVAQLDEVVAPAPSISGDSYKVQRNDTLWTIASKIKAPSTSNEQMMVALQRANPGAFNDNNINNLKSGAVLTIPDNEVALAVSRKQALQVVKNQYQDWKTGGTPTKPSKGSPKVASSKSTAASSKAPAIETAEVKLVSPKAKGSIDGGLGGDGKAVLEQAEKDLTLAKEALAASESAKSDLQGQIDSLQRQVENMKRLLTLKDDSLAEMQGKLATLQGATPEPAPAVPEASVPPVPETPVTPPAPVEETPAATPTPQPEQVAGINQYAKKDFPKADLSKIKAAPKKAPPAPPVSSDDTSGLLDDPVMIAGLLLVLAFIGFLFWQIWRRRMRNIQFPESILTERSGLDTTKAASEETSLLSDFAPSSMDSSLDTQVDEVDALSEADVYLAYNKFDQAEELLLEAISNQPERVELKVKLMEVYFTAKNSDSFLRSAQALHDELGGTNTAVWEKVEEMGKVLCPDSPLFGGEVVEEEIPVADDSLAEIDDTPELETELGDLSLDTDKSDDNFGFDEVNLDLSSDDDKLDADLAELESELDALSTDTDVETTIDVPETSIDDMSLDFDADTATEAAPAEEETQEGAEDDALSMDEVATKLDLAKAYIDMGDPDGAMSILEEVMTEGNQSQRDEAQSLMGQLK